MPGDVVVINDDEVTVFTGRMAHEWLRVEIEGRAGTRYRDHLAENLRGMSFRKVKQ